MPAIATVGLAASRAVTAVFPQRFVALEDAAVGVRDLLGVTVV